MKTPRWKTVLIRELHKAEHQLILALSKEPSIVPIHEARKSIKLLRAALRLLRAAIPSRKFKAINGSLREAGLAISPLRDKEVLRKLTIRLMQVQGTRPSPSLAPSSSRRPLSLALRKLKTAGRHLEALSWEKMDRYTQCGGLKRLYRRARRAAKESGRHGSDNTLHTWRKRTKDLTYALRLTGLQNSRITKQLLRLAKHLGDDHDLVLFLEEMPQGKGMARLRRRARDERRKHQKIAFEIGNRLLCHRPAHFVQRMASRGQA